MEGHQVFGDGPSAPKRQQVVGEAPVKRKKKPKVSGFSVRRWLFSGSVIINKRYLQGGPLPVISGLISPLSRVFSPQLPIYFRPFIRVITSSIYN